jgi:hypothetical protein
MIAKILRGINYFRKVKAINDKPHLTQRLHVLNPGAGMARGHQGKLQSMDNPALFCHDENQGKCRYSFVIPGIILQGKVFDV